MTKEISIGERTFSYELSRKPVKNINLRIRSDGSIAVSAPVNLPLAVIERFIRSKSDFILRALERSQLRRLSKTDETPVPTFENGDCVRLLGKDIRIELLKGNRNMAVLSEDRLRLFVKDPSDCEARQKTVSVWKMNFCKSFLLERCRHFYPIFQSCGIPFPEIKFRRMKRRWGSCHPQTHRLIFQYDLIEADPDCIDYVVVHEFCHFLQPNHSKAFYIEVSKILPDWKELQDRLNGKEQKAKTGDFH